MPVERFVKWEFWQKEMIISVRSKGQHRHSRAEAFILGHFSACPWFSTSYSGGMDSYFPKHDQAHFFPWKFALAVCSAWNALHGLFPHLLSLGSNDTFSVKLSLNTPLKITIVHSILLWKYYCILLNPKCYHWWFISLYYDPP